MLEKPIFIIGHPKSGTSLLTALLDSHPELLVLSEESDLYLNVWRRARILNWEWRLNKEEKVQALMSHLTKVSHIKNYFRGKVETDISGNFDYSNLDHKLFYDKLINFLRSERKFNRKKLLLGIIKAYQETAYNKECSQQKYWVEKTPKNTWHINEILEDFPEAKFIFIYRDPRDNYVSFRKKLGNKLNAISFSYSWNDAFKLARQIEPLNIHYIKYEELINNPETTMRQVANYLKINYNIELLSPTKLGGPWKGNSMFGAKSNSFRTDSIGRYKKIISIEDLDIIEAFCEEKMREKGYELETNVEFGRNVKEKYLPEYNKVIPFGINKPITLRSRLGKLRIMLSGKLK